MSLAGWEPTCSAGSPPLATSSHRPDTAMNQPPEKRSKRRWWRGLADRSAPEDGSIAANPTLRAVTESGVTWDDPSEDLLFEVLADLEHDVEKFFVVHRVEHDDVYMQILMQEDRTYLLEYRDGDASSHFGAVSADKRLVHEVLVNWAFLSPDFRNTLDWTPVVF